MHPTDEYQNTCAPRLTDQRFTNDQRISRGGSRKPWNAIANSSFMGRVLPLKNVENASRAPKARAKKMFGLFGESCADKTPKHNPKSLLYTKNERSVKWTGSRTLCFCARSPVKELENASRAPKARAKKNWLFGWWLLVRKTPKIAPKFTLRGFPAHPRTITDWCVNGATNMTMAPTDWFSSHLPQAKVEAFTRSLSARSTVSSLSWWSKT